MAKNYNPYPGFKKTIIVFLLAMPLLSIAQTTDNGWRYLKIPNKGMKSVKSVTEMKVDTVHGLGLVIVKGNDKHHELVGYIVNNTDTLVSISMLDPFVDNCTTYILKEGKWTEFQITDHSGIDCGNSYWQDSLMPRKALSFPVLPATNGALSVKMCLGIKSHNYALTSNIVEIYISDEQYKAAGKEMPPQYRSEEAGAKSAANGMALFQEMKYTEAKQAFEESAKAYEMTPFLSKRIAECDSLMKVGEGE